MKAVILILIVSIITILASASWLILLFIVLSKKVKNREVLKRYLRIYMSLALLILLSSCGSGRQIQKKNRFLVTIESSVPKMIVVKRFPDAGKVDSVVIRNFGHAIEGFNSDSIFFYSPFFRVETEKRTVYGEKKKMTKPKRN